MKQKHARRLFGMMFALAALPACSRNPATTKRQYFESGERYVAERKYPEAIVQFRNAIARDPQFGEARHSLAVAYAHLNDAVNAQREFVRAADLMPDDVQAQLDAGKALILAGQFDDAKSRAERVLHGHPDNVDALIVMGNATAGLKDLDKAVEEIQQAIELNPSRSATYTNLGSLQLARGKRDEAEAAFKQAVTVDPKSVGAHLALANYSLSIGQLTEAENGLKKALELEPQNVAANRALAIFYLATNRAPQAERYLQAIVQTTPDSSPRLALADFYISQKRPADATKVLNELALRKEAFAAAKSRLAGVEYAAGHNAEAHKIIDEVLAREPNNADVLVVKGRWLLDEKKTPEALSKAKAAVAANPRFAGAHFLLGLAYLASNDEDSAIKSLNEVVTLNPRALDAQVRLSLLHLARGRTDLAIQLAQQALKTQPGNVAARLALVQALTSQNSLSQAESELQPLLKAVPDSVAVQVQLATIQLKKGDRVAARRSFDRAVALDPTSLAAVEGLLTLDVEAKDNGAARRRVEAVLARTPDDADVLLLAAKTYAAVGALDRAEEALLRAIKVAPSFLPAYGVLGQLYVQQQRLDEARTEFEALAHQEPRNVGAHTMAAMILSIQNKQVEARQRYEKILEIDPNAAVAANNLAYIHADAGTNLDLALQLAQTAKGQLPEDPDVNDTLGWVYYKRNLPSLAIDPLQRSVEKSPSNPVYRYHLGLAYLGVGEKAKARASLQQALKLKWDSPEAAEAKKVLDSIQG